MNASHYTKWHRFVAAAYSFLNGPSVNDDKHRLARTIFSQNEKEILTRPRPIFVMDLIIDDPETGWRNSFKELIEHLNYIPAPFQDFIIEFSFDNKPGRYFAHYEIDDDRRGLTANIFYFSPISNFATCVLDGLRSTIEGTETEFHTTLDNEDTGQTVEQYVTSCQQLVRHPLSKLITLLSTQGIEPITISAPRLLNKERARKRKPIIPDVLILKIRHYYSRDGKQHTFDERQPVRIHWRRGHNRRVWCGAGEHRHLEDRYIMPCLVNFKGDDPLPEHPVRVLQ